jgi:hypothetical protein
MEWQRTMEEKQRGETDNDNGDVHLIPILCPNQPGEQRDPDIPFTIAFAKAHHPGLLSTRLSVPR